MSLITYVSPAMLQSAFRWIERRRRGHVSKYLQVNPVAGPEVEFLGNSQELGGAVAAVGGPENLAAVQSMAIYPPGALQNFKNSAQFGEIIRFIHAKQANRSRFSSQP